MKLSNRRLWMLGAIAIAIILLLTLFAAPNNNQLTRGSTYSRDPEGYGAWYAFMEKRETPIKRWQKPLSDLIDSREKNTPIALLRVNSQLSHIGIGDREKKWLEKGNTLAILGVHQPVTKADFTTIQSSSAGSVKIETRRRLQINEKATSSDKTPNAKNETTIQSQLLGDRFGAVVWEEKIGKGRLIVATTPYLAANAYQDAPGNYEFLAQLIAQTGNNIWVDEYMHGYRDKSEGDREEISGNWFNYLAKTPLTSVLLQASIILIVLLWAQNRRFGQPLPLEAPVIDNSEAYIQALAGVLQKAQSSEFVVEVLGKEEQIQLQKALGLGTVLLEPNELATAWVQQTGREAKLSRRESPAELQQLLQLNAEKSRIRESDLLSWLEKWQKIRQHSA